MIVRVLVATNDLDLLRRLRPLLSDADVLLYNARSSRDLWDELRNESYDLVLIDRELLGSSSRDAISAARNMPDRPEVAVLSSRADPEDNAILVAEGCIAVLDTQLKDKLIAEALGAVIERRKNRLNERLGLGPPSSRIEPRLENFVSNSPSMQAFMKVVRRIARSQATLLITGETGVGKEWLARAIHGDSARSRQPFVALNCGALAESLLESELFGHEEGSFTGASRARRGMFELAHGGTIFLDEIGEMPLHLQVKLLRVLQDREIQRVGAEKTLSIDVRIMAATNRDLVQEVEARTFRRDLYFRLSVVTLEMPPLRQRREDIPELVESIVDHFRMQLPQGVERVTSEAMDALTSYEWPGNIRELMNILERTMLLCDSDRIDVSDLPHFVVGQGDFGRAGGGDQTTADMLPPDWLDLPLKALRSQVLAELERVYLSHHLSESRGRIGETAQRIGLDTRSLYAKMQALGLDKGDFKAS